MAEIESIEQLIHDAESDQADKFNIPEHPAVSLIGDDSRVRTSPCIACHSTSARRFYSIGGVFEELVECDSCGLGSIFPMPDSDPNSIVLPG